jgi:hypothetical protein
LAAFKTILVAARAAFGIAGSLVGISAHAQQFSADLVHRNAGGELAGRTGKLNVSNGKVRIETPDVPTGIFIVYADLNAAYFMRPAQHTFMDAMQSSQLTQLLVVIDPDDPCRQWQAMAKVAGVVRDGSQWRCERIGHDTIDDATP